MKDDVQIVPGRYELHGSTFIMAGHEFMLGERGKPQKGKPLYFLVACPGGHVSGLWQQRDKQFRFDHRATDDIERVYHIDFSQPGYVTITGGEPSRRAMATAPWRRGVRGS